MEEKNEKKTKRKTKSKKYPLPEARLKFEEELKVLKALVEYSNKGKEPVSNKDVEEVAKNEYYASTELSFFNSVGFADKLKKGKYVPTKKVIDLVKNLNWEDEKNAKKILREILSESWFGDEVIKMLKVEKEKSLDDIIRVLGKKADANRKKDKKAIERLLEWLTYADIIEVDENGMVHLKEVSISEKTEAPSLVAEKMGSISKTVLEEEMVKSEEIKRGQKGILLNITINFQIDSNTDVEKIREIIRVIKQDLVKDSYE